LGYTQSCRYFTLSGLVYDYFRALKGRHNLAKGDSLSQREKNVQLLNYIDRLEPSSQRGTDNLNKQPLPEAKSRTLLNSPPTLAPLHTSSQTFTYFAIFNLYTIPVTNILFNS
tara:strand:- start:21103 stop:21441 length:339 start_codon:yes stop_codon:yes gene_type:complete